MENNGGRDLNKIINEIYKSVKAAFNILLEIQQMYVKDTEC